MKKPYDLTNNRYGSLVAVKRVAKTKFNVSIWLCKCDCGKEKEILSGNLKSGNTTNCGCKRKEIALKVASNRNYFGSNNPFWAKTHSKEVREIYSKRNKLLIGEKAFNWKGGITPINTKIRNSTEYKEWRKSVFERDNYTCVLCHIRSKAGKQVTLNADHIKPFALFPELRLDINNGRTLCIDCHKKTDTYCGRTKKYVNNFV